MHALFVHEHPAIPTTAERPVTMGWKPMRRSMKKASQCLEVSRHWEAGGREDEKGSLKNTLECFNGQ